ncbi:HK97 family phage prohead protease [Roseibium aggregatum]|uniref:HK97 family phage prohead protease n=1 Tax=Roseibium aggregatum TaxID=187304 RepID=UPI003A982192
MELGSPFGELVLEERAARSRARRLKGRFPYNKRAVISDGGRNGGRPRKEEFAPRAFSYRVDLPDEDIHLLIGHSYDRPLASRGAGTLTLKDADDALTFEAIISEEMQQVTWVQDFFAAYSANLIRGISPGFRIPPPRAVEKAEEVTEEDPSLGTALIRTIFAALLYELSLVTRPAYDETEVEAEERSAGGIILPKPHPLKRWRL